MKNSLPRAMVDQSRRAPVFERIASQVTNWTGATSTFIIALSLVVVWGVSGPYFRYSDTWQLIVNSGTSIITFLMVFLIQRSQNRDMLAIKIQMSELIASIEQANNRVIDLEHLSEQQLAKLYRHYQRFSKQYRTDINGTPEQPDSHDTNRA